MTCSCSSKSHTFITMLSHAPNHVPGHHQANVGPLILESNFQFSSCWNRWFMIPNIVSKNDLYVFYKIQVWWECWPLHVVHVVLLHEDRDDPVMTSIVVHESELESYSDSHGYENGFQNIILIAYGIYIPLDYVNLCSMMYWDAAPDHHWAPTLPIYVICKLRVHGVLALSPDSPHLTRLSGWSTLKRLICEEDMWPLVNGPLEVFWAPARRAQTDPGGMMELISQDTGRYKRIWTSQNSEISVIPGISTPYMYMPWSRSSLIIPVISRRF